MNNPPLSLKALLIYVNQEELVGEPKQLATYIAHSKHVITWWNFIPSLWVITTNSNSIQLNDDLLEFLGPNTDFFVTEMNPLSAVGTTNSGGWPAFDKDIRTKFRPSPK